MKLLLFYLKKTGNSVAPLAGAWIETLGVVTANTTAFQVAPLAGAWIETFIESAAFCDEEGRSPCGSVD